MNNNKGRFLAVLVALAIIICLFTIKSTVRSWSSIVKVTTNQGVRVEGSFKIATTRQATVARSAGTTPIDTLGDGGDEPSLTSAFVGVEGNHERTNKAQISSLQASLPITPSDQDDTPVTTTPPTEEPLVNSTITPIGNFTMDDGGVQEFVHHPGVVIATKIHGAAFVPELKQSLCLLHAAYNNRLLYDIIVFVTIALPEKDMNDIRGICHPANVTFVQDAQTFEEQIADLTPAQQQTLVDRCPGVNRTDQLSWQERCQDGKHTMPLAYCWMSEFRSKQIWTQDALARYKYMMWFDTDSFPTMVWKQDPVAFMIRNNLVLLTGNYPQGRIKAKTGVHYRIAQAYNKTLCKSGLQEGGRLIVGYSPPRRCKRAVLGAHGFFHVTDLDFYRLPVNLHWSKVLIGDGKFQRMWDDQLAIIVPPAMLAPERVRDMEGAGLKLEVMHNGLIMGKRNWVGGAYLQFFRTEGKTKFPEAQICQPFIKVPSR